MSKWTMHKEGMSLVLICGSREYDNAEKMAEVIEEIEAESPGELMIVEGGCRGADTLAAQLAEANGIPYAEVPAHWDYYGTKAGPLRNRWMLALDPRLVVAFHENIEESSGTIDTLQASESLGINTRLVEE